MTDEASATMLQMWLDDKYSKLRPINKRKPYLWYIFLASLILAAHTFIEPSARRATLQAVGVVGYALLVLTPMVSGLLLAMDHFKARKIWREIMVLYDRVESAGMDYCPSYGTEPSEMRPIKPRNP